MELQSAVIKVPPILDAYQIRHLQGSSNAGSVPGQNSRRDGFMSSRHLVDGHPAESRFVFRPKQWSREQKSLNQAYIFEFQCTASVIGSYSAIEREISLCAFDQPAVRHHARVAHTTGQDTDGHLAFFRDHIPVKRKRSVAGKRSPRRFVPLAVTD